MFDMIVVRRAEVGGRTVDVWWRAGTVFAVVPPGSPPPDGDARVVDELDAGGGAVIPGLHDHHIHLLALAAAQRSAPAGPPGVRNVGELADRLEHACHRSTDGWVRAVGYHESVAGDLDGATLDQLFPGGHEVPIRVQHRSGQLWILNGAAARLADLDSIASSGVERDHTGRPTGRVYGLDDELRSRIPRRMPDLAAVGRRLASFGVTGVTDLTPTTSADDLELLAASVLAGGFPLHVTVTGGLHLPERAAPALPRGPVKFLPADHQVFDLDALAADFSRAHRAGRAVAVHCVTRIGLVIALSAWRAAGVRPGDRIEHGAVIPAELLDELRDLGVIVISQPNFVAERGDQYLSDVDPADLPHLWRCGSLDRGRIGLALGTDAPFGHPDPWRSIDAAARRQTPSGAVFGNHEMIEPRRGLELFQGSPGLPTRPRSIVEGARTDLCVLGVSLAEALRESSAPAVLATVGRAGLHIVDHDGEGDFPA